MVDHDSDRLGWAAPGREKATLNRLFDALGEERSTLIIHVSADGADWISAVWSHGVGNLSEQKHLSNGGGTALKSGAARMRWRADAPHPSEPTTKAQPHD